MQVVAISWHLFQLTKSAYYLGFIGLAGFIPMLLLSSFSGMLVDAFDRKKIILLDQLMLTIINGTFALVTYFHHDTPWIIFTVIVLNACVNVIDLPARQSIIPSLVPKSSLIVALNVNTIFRQTATIIGPAIAGYLIAAFGVGVIYGINALTFLVCFLLVIPIVTQSAYTKKSVRFTFISAFEGIRYIKSSPILYSTILLDFFANFFAASTVIFPIFAMQILHISTKEIGLLYAAPSVGAVVTGLLIGTVSHIRQQGKLLLGVVALYGAATIGFGLSHWFLLSLLCLAIVGGADMISMVIRATISQLVTPDQIRGRMNAINMVFLLGGPFLGEAEAGFAAGLLGAPLSVILGGLGAICSAGVIAKFVPELTEYVYKNREFDKIA